MDNLTGVEVIINWLEQSGVLDIMSDTMADFVVKVIQGILEVLIRLFASGAVLLVGAIVALVVSVLTGIISLVGYVFRSIGLMCIAKKLGVQHRFLAWIPFGWYYLVGDCAEKGIARDGKKPWKWGLILILTGLAVTVGMPLVQAVVAIILSFIPPLSTFLNLVLSSSGLIFAGLYCYCLYRVFNQFVGKTGSIILSVCVAVLGPVEGLIIFVVGCMKLHQSEIQEKEPVEEFEQSQPALMPATDGE